MAKLSVELQRYFLSDMANDTMSAAPADSPVDASVESFSSQDRAPVVKAAEVTLNEILELAGERTFGFLFGLLSIPSALPVPAPGYSTPFGLVMLLLSVQLMIGKDQPWVPEKWRKRGFEREQVQTFLQKGLPWLQRIEKVSRPRLTPICTSRVGQAIVGLVLTLASMSMILPLPLTNTVPAMGIFVVGLGLFDDDGLLSLAGVAICSLGLAITSSLLYLIIFVFGLSNISGAEDAVKDWIKNRF
ncbi:MAG: exopolysaccharide biosynthesis protein [Cyanobacteria bacterium P01_F01_bin.3]